MSEKKLLTIDLLKGQGIPTRSNPDKIALMAVTIIVPTIISMTMFGYFWKNNVLISIQRQKILNYERGINKLHQSQLLLDKSVQEKKYRDECLAEVAQNISKRYQWTPAIIEIVKLMPDSVLLKGIDIKQNNIRKTVPSKKQGGPDVEISVPITKLKISVTEKSASREQTIREFQDQIRSSAVFGPLLDTIAVSQGIDSFKGQDTVSYQIECTFKQSN